MPGSGEQADLAETESALAERSVSAVSEQSIPSNLTLCVASERLSFRSISLGLLVGITVDIPLKVALLRRLKELERTFQSGNVIVVGPHVDGMIITNTVSFPGEDSHVVEAHLRRLLVEGLVENGGLYHPGIGIHFARLTRRGRRWLQDHGDPSAKDMASNGTAKITGIANGVAPNVAEGQVTAAKRDEMRAKRVCKKRHHKPG